MADEKLAIGIVAELSEFRKAMSELPGIGETEARDMVRGIQRELKKAQSSAKNTADAFQSDWKESFEKTGIFAKEVTSQLVPALAPVADIVEGIGSNFNDLVEALGPAGLAIGGIAISIGAAAAASAALVSGAVRVADAALEARDRLREAKNELEVPGEALASLDRYEQSWRDLKLALDETVVVLGADIAVYLGVMNKLMADGIDTINDNATAWQSFWQSAISTVIGPAGQQALQWMSDLTAETRENIEATLDEEIAQRKLMEEFRLVGEEIERLIDARVERDRTAYATQRREAAQFYYEIVQLARQADQEALDFKMGIIEAEKIVEQEAFDANIARFKALSAARRQSAADAKAQATAERQVWLQFTQDILSFQRTITDAVFEGYAERSRSLDEAYERDLAAAEGKSDAEIQNIVDTYNREKEEARKRADLAYGLSKSFAATSAIISAAVLGSNVAANLSTFMGPAAIPVAIAAAGAFLAGQLATIATAPPPEYPTGLTPDHHYVGIQNGEGVANRNAMADEEFRAMLGAQNAGRSWRDVAGGGGTTDVRISLDPRTGRLRLSRERIGKRDRRRRG